MLYEVITGDHVPVIPFVEVVGNAGIEAPEQYGPTDAKVGVTFGLITTSVVTGGLVLAPTVITKL